MRSACTTPVRLVPDDDDGRHAASVGDQQLAENESVPARFIGRIDGQVRALGSDFQVLNADPPENVFAQKPASGGWREGATRFWVTAQGIGSGTFNSIIRSWRACTIGTARERSVCSRRGTGSLRAHQLAGDNLWIRST
jgi:hypothetical protein